MSEDKVCCHLRYFGKCPKHGISEWVFDEQRKQLKAADNLAKTLKQELEAPHFEGTTVGETGCLMGIAADALKEYEKARRGT